MGCQRHNAETCKRALEQKIKDQERTNQKVRSHAKKLASSLLFEEGVGLSALQPPPPPPPPPHRGGRGQDHI